MINLPMPLWRTNNDENASSSPMRQLGVGSVTENNPKLTHGADLDAQALVSCFRKCRRLVAFAALTIAAQAQQPNPATQQDHQRLMDLLHITELRKGADGSHPDAPNYANYDESKANPYPNLPDPLVLKNGKKVKSAKDWWTKRRPEIVEDFDREIYGRVPPNIPAVKWELVSTTRATLKN